jgi:Ca2+-binding EF-hand superfamily protein
VDDSAEEEELAPAKRILLLSSVGPLVVDLHVSIEGVPFQETFDGLLDHALQLGDANEDGTVTWNELMGHPRFRYGQFGNPATGTYQNRNDMVRLYDTRKNGRVDRDELARYLTSNQGIARAMSFTTSEVRREAARDDSPVRQILDANNDFEISEDEIASAEVRLLLKDANDDEILTPSDFSNAGMQQPGMAMTTRRSSSGIYRPNTAWHLHEDTIWSDLLVGLKELYGFGGSPQAEDFMLSSDLFAQLDVDGDGEITTFEMDMLLTVPPHFALVIDIAAEAEGEQYGSSANVALASMRIDEDQIHSIVQHQPNRLTVSVADVTLDFYADDRLGRSDSKRRAEALLAQADVDKDESISSEEFGAVAPQFNNAEFDGVDTDQDGKVLLEEITTFFQQQTASQAGRIRVLADDQQDVLFPTLDRNHDGRIDGREVAQVGRSLLSLDANADGSVQIGELHGGMVIGVVRGANQFDNTFQLPVTRARTSEAAPRWFRGMDRNQDGGISWREFIGTRVQFDELDRDHDGFVDVHEAGSDLADDE